MTLILHTHIKGEKNSYREHATWKWFEFNDAAIETQGWDVAHVQIETGPKHHYDYDGVIRHFWGKDDLLIFERDMVPLSFQSIVDLVNCPEESCSIDYPLIRCWCIEMESRSGKNLMRQGEASRIVVCCAHKTENSMMRNNPPAEDTLNEAYWSDGTWTWADMAPLGLTRFRKTLQMRVSAGWRATSWLELDGILTGSLALNGIRTHIHMPWAKHMRKRTSMTTHDLVATLALDTPVAYATDLKPEYYLKAMARLKAGMNHAMRPLVVVP